MGNKQSGRSDSGQALLIVVLVMVVSLTVGLAVASRSVTNLRISTEEENSQRAFSAAEAGVERWLETGATSAIDLGNKAAISKVNIVSVSGNQFLVNGGNMVEKDDGADVWLVEHDANGRPIFSSPWLGNSLTFYWGSSSDVCNSDPSKNTMAALEIIVISGTQALPTSKRSVFDPCADDRRRLNNFASQGPGGVIGGRSFAYSTGAIAVSSGLIARIIPLYSSASIGVIGNIALPSQGNRIESTGVSGGTSRKIAFYQGYPTLPSEFFYILFSPR